MAEKGRIVNAETSLHLTNAAVLLNQPMAAEGHIINSTKLYHTHYLLFICFGL